MSSPSLTPEQRRHHFEVERELASRLKSSTRAERPALVPELYSELYRRVPFHPRTLRVKDVESQGANLSSQWRLLTPFIREGMRFTEFGAGSGAFARSVAAKLPHSTVTALEVCTQEGAAEKCPANFSWLLHDGLSVPLADGSVDVAFSYQVLEHLHPDDVPVHLAEVFRVLKPGGCYVLSTPHEASGPHDVSRHFGLELQTFHIREWSYRELERELAQAGFGKAGIFWRGRLRQPGGLAHCGVRALETALSWLPRRLSVRLARWCLNNVVLFASKPSA
jgi:SAM-dependent methyltransferase